MSTKECHGTVPVLRQTSSGKPGSGSFQEIWPRGVMQRAYFTGPSTRIPVFTKCCGKLVTL